MDSAAHLLGTAHHVYARSGGMGGDTQGRPAVYKVVGLVLAIASGLFIGVSFVLKKHGLLKANVKYNEAALRDKLIKSSTLPRSPTMAEHHPLPALPPQYQEPNQQRYDQQEPHVYQEQQPYSPHHHEQFQPPQLPPPPTQVPPQKHSKSRSRTFSFQSNKSQKSHKSTGSSHKIDLHETSEEKEAKRLHTKADPTVAMSEAEPSVVQAMTKSSMAPLRSIQHRDSLGNPIAEPDRSNPTRSRWERPLDTIRSFEAAIDGGYRERDRQTDSIATWNRRSSYYATSGPRYPQDSNYVSRPGSYRPESSHVEMGSTRQSYYDPYQNGGGHHGGNNVPYRQRIPRTHTDSHMSGYARGEQNVYPLPTKDRSYETVTSVTGTGSSAEHAGYYTDPTSSDNSSFERAPMPPKPEPINDYGIGFSPSPTYHQSASFNFDNSASNGQAHQIMNGGPPVPEKSTVSRRPVPAPQQKQQQGQQQRPESPAKRKTWFSRRFSKAS